MSEEKETSQKLTDSDTCKSLLDKGFVRLVDHMGDDNSIVQMARVSYGAGTKKVSQDRGLIRYLMRHRHTSPFEGVQFKFHVKAPIFVFRQWHRHRTWAFNEYSGRYSEMKDEYYVPQEQHVTAQNPHNKQGGSNAILPPLNIDNSDEWEEDVKTWSWHDHFQGEQELIRQNYERYLKTGMRRELARINLPLSQYSEMYATVNLHNLLHFTKLRQDSHAQYEIRVYADALIDIIRPIVPIAVEAYEEYVLKSLTLTQKDQQAISKLLQNVAYLRAPEIITKADGVFDNEREKQEFLQKLDRILFTK